MSKWLKGVAAAAALVWAGSAQAVIIKVTGNLTYTERLDDGYTPPWEQEPTVINVPNFTFQLIGDSWADRFIVSGLDFERAFPSLTCGQITDWEGGCLTTSIVGNSIRFEGPEYGGFYQGLNISLNFDFPIPDRPDLLDTTSFSGGAITWYYGHHNGSVSLAGPLTMISFVPEPATWAMTLAGFGLIGGAMRRVRPAPIPAR